MDTILTHQRVHQLREEIGELKIMNEVYKDKKGPVADTERAHRQDRLLKIQDELKMMAAQKVQSKPAR